MWNHAYKTIFTILLAAILFFVNGPLSLATAEENMTPGQKAIESYIEAHAQGGVFAIYDSREEKALALDPGAIHSTAHLMKSGETYYCVDFTGNDGTTYDLDFYVDEAGERPVVEEFFIHKVNGRDRIRTTKDADAVPESVAEEIRSAITLAWADPRNLYDKRLGKTTTFSYENVHQGVKEVDGGNYYACVDARDQDNVLYDLDTYVKSTGDGGYEIVEILLHKRDGVERLR